MKYYKYLYDGEVTEIFRVHENDTWEYLKLDNRKKGWTLQDAPLRIHFKNIINKRWSGEIVECTMADAFKELL